MNISNNPQELSEQEASRKKAFLAQTVVALVAMVSLVAWLFYINQVAPPRTQPAQNAPLTKNNISKPLAPAPNLKIALDGSAKTLQVLPPHKITLISFWASWCNPCKTELPQLLSQQQSWPNTQLVLINLDNQPSGIQQARMFLQHIVNDKTLSIFREEHSVGIDGWMASLEIEQIPYHVLIDSDGFIRWRYFGTIHWSAPTVREAVLSL